MMLWRRHRLEDIKLHSWVEADGRARVRIAVIDDEPFTKASNLLSHGFRLTELRDIPEVSMLRDFEVVLCDIHGVGKSLGSKYEGAQIIQEIRAHFPTKYVVLFSALSFDTSYNRFFSLCDTQLQKDSDITTVIECLDRGIYCVSDPAERWRRMRAFLIKQGMDLRDVAHLERDYISGVKKASPEPLSSSNVLPRLPNSVREILIDFAVSGIVQASKEWLK